MFRRSRSSIPFEEDPAVALVEEILEARASRSSGTAPRRDGRLVVSHAIWPCACETMQDSPVWLIYAVGEDGVGSQRLPAGMRESDVVDAEHLTGGHPDPDSVLAWLRSDATDRWPVRSDLVEDAFIYEEIRRRIGSD